MNLKRKKTVNQELYLGIKRHKYGFFGAISLRSGFQASTPPYISHFLIHMCPNYSDSPPLARQRKNRKLMMTEFTKRYDVDYDALACCSMFMLLPMKVN